MATTRVMAATGFWSGPVSPARLLAIALGLSEDAAKDLLARQLRGAKAPSIEVALGKMLAEAWNREPAELARNLMTSHVLLEIPRRRHLHRPKLTDVIVPADWETLLESRYLEILEWGARDWAHWLNELIRARVAVEPGQRANRSASPGSTLPIEQAAKTLFYV